MTTIIQLCRPGEVEQHNIIALRPEKGEIGQWVVDSCAPVDGWFTRIEWHQADGATGCFVLEPKHGVAVELAALLTPNQRAGEFNGLSNFGTGRITRWLYVKHPALFDQAVRDFNRSPYFPEVA